MDNKLNFGQRLTVSFIRLLSGKSLKAHYRSARFVASLMEKTLRYRRDEILINLSRSFPELKYGEIKDLCHRFYRHFANVFAEAIWFSGCHGEKGQDRFLGQRIIDITNPEVFNTLYGNGRSMVVLNSHMGNWELLGGISYYHADKIAPLDLPPLEIVVAYRALRSKFWDGVMHALRCGPLEHVKYEGYVESNLMLRHAVSHRNDRRCYVFSIDQFPYGNSARVDVGTFMNQPTAAMSGAAALACRLGMSVIYPSWHSRPDGGWYMTFIPISEDASKETPETIMRKYYDLIEEDIRKEPESYLWSHKRWK